MGLKFKLFIIMCKVTMSVSFNLGVPHPASSGASSAAPKATSSAATKTATKATIVSAIVPASKAVCKYGDKCHGCNVCKKGGKGGKGGGAQVAQVAQLSSQVNDLQNELASMKAVSAATDVRLDTVNAKVDKTNSSIDAMLAMMREDRTQRAALPPLPARPAIMPPPSTQRSQSPPPRMTLVTSGTEGSFGQVCGHWVPGWESSKSTSKSSGSYMGQNGWADKAVAGGGAMVVSKPTGTLPSPSSLSRKGPLPSPSSLPESGRKSTSISGSGLVRCNDSPAFLQLLTEKGWTTLLGLLQSKGDTPTNHLLTAAVNAVALSPDNEVKAFAITCFDRARCMSAFDPHLHGQMRTAFDPENPAFKQFCIRMADYCSKSPDKGIKFRGQTYPYAHLVQNDQHRKELIAALRDN